MVAVAAVAGGVASVAGSAISGSQQSGAISDASGASVAEQAREYDQSRADQLPWLTAGQNALAPLADASGVNGADGMSRAIAAFQASPGYGYQVQQSLKAVDRGAAAQGLLRSGATLRAEQTLGANLANQDFGTYVNRLAGIAGTGQTSAQNLGALGTAAAAGEAQTLASAGGAQASIYGKEWGNIGNAINNGLGNFAYQQRSNALASPNDPFAGTASSADTAFMPSDSAWTFGGGF